MIPRFRLHLSFSELARAAIRSPSDSIEVLEATFKSVYGFSEAVWFPFARTAVRAYLDTLAARGDVVLSPFNCVALGQGVASSGRKLFYVDTSGQDFNQDTTQFRAALNRKEAACGVAVPLWGSDWDAELTAGVEKPILYDFALRGLANDKFPHLKNTDGVVYSLGWGKPLSAFRGAMLCGNSLKQAISWRDYRDQRLTQGNGLRIWLEAAALWASGHPSVFGMALSFAERKSWAKGILGRDAGTRELGARYFTVPPAWTFSLGVQRLAERETMRAQRKQQVIRYRELLEGLPLKLPEGDYLSHYAIRTSGRNALHDFLKTKGFFTSHQLFARLLSDYEPFRGPSWRPLENAQKLVSETLHLPLFHGLKEESQNRISSLIKVWCAGQKQEGGNYVAEALWRRV